MFPRRPVFLGGLIAPIMWSGLLYTTLDIINPVMNHRINWLWFVLSQVGFGVVAGLWCRASTNPHVSGTAVCCPCRDRSARRHERKDEE